MYRGSPRQQTCTQPRGETPREDTLLVKVHFDKTLRGVNSEIRKFRMNKNGLTFTALESKILQICQVQLKQGKGIDIKYKDEDGDLVLFRCDEGLNIALEESATNGKFTIFVEENYNHGFGY
ncbi:hypothetical protein NQD34_011076 [Periophthalmus magnuspinnatus]|nr:hypothetical protein NQD34_011076 [Periophthalmus magnuspinnatus]